MFRSSTILRVLVQSLAKVTFLSKHLIKLRRCMLCGYVAACRETACVLFVEKTVFFNVLLTVYLSITFVNKQLVAQLLYFIICLLQPYTCFEQRRAHHQEEIFY